MWIATAERTREIDRSAAERYGLDAKVLMERAGLSVFQSIQEMLPSGRVTVFCGRGNNGGDGFVVARHCHLAGYGVDVLVAANESEISPDAKVQLDMARAQGVEPIFADDARFARKAECVGCRDLIVDALLGTGAHNEVRDPIRYAIQAINRSGVPVISVDIPSGVLCDTGEELGESVWALRTVTFGLPKPFLFQGIGLEHSGYWSIGDIGYPLALLEEETEAQTIDALWVSQMLPERLRASHKGDNGSVLIVAGSANMPGAASLAARAAYRAGAGLVTVAGIPAVCQAVASHVPEAILLPLPETHGVVSADAARVVLERQHKYHSAVFGPGMTHEEPVMEFLAKVWAEWSRPSVVDADGLNAVALGVPPPVQDAVMTPHPGEMSRLLRCSIAEVQTDRFRAVRSALVQYSQTVLLKGPYSIVGEHGQPMNVNSAGNPGMASAGMGDVLSGIIATLLAQEVPPYFAASCGMFWHAVAGDLCAEEIGPVGYTAMDVAQALPKARATILATCEAS